ncbi:MAG TPA: thioredoxin domain-containing protein [Candidatus Baltobacteraceae bacterium]|nr:thioredoxin domain-containing protein [Candidatus Baltobacteraceae bacterium]
MNSFLIKPVGMILGIGVLAWTSTACGWAQEKPEAGQDPPAAAPSTKSGSKQTAAAAAAALEEQDLQKAIERASNDRAALMHNLMDFLKKYPQSSQRPQIYRAIVESSLQLREFSTAMEYAERMVALDPGDLSTNLLSVQLLERYGDAAGWRRATSYCTRVLDLIRREPVKDKSPRKSGEQFEKDKQHDVASILLVRGRLFQKLNEPQNAQRDFEGSYKMAPGSAAAERLGELAEIRKDFPTAIHEYALAFALADGLQGSASRLEVRKKLGNVWRLAHGSEDGLGDYVLRAIDEAMTVGIDPKPARNKGLKDPMEFVLRKAPDGPAFALADAKGKVLVLNFWATWCGPCREWEPHFEKVAGHFLGREKEVVFLEVNCDEDETLVGPYLAELKPRTTEVFADGLEDLLHVNSFPTTVILSRTGKIAYRTEGFDPDGRDQVLIDAIDGAIIH